MATLSDYEVRALCSWVYPLLAALYASWYTFSVMYVGGFDYNSFPGYLKPVLVWFVIFAIPMFLTMVPFSNMIIPMYFMYKSWGLCFDIFTYLGAEGFWCYITAFIVSSLVLGVLHASISFYSEDVFE